MGPQPCGAGSDHVRAASGPFAFIDSELQAKKGLLAKALAQQLPIDWRQGSSAGIGRLPSPTWALYQQRQRNDQGPDKCC